MLTHVSPFPVSFPDSILAMWVWEWDCHHLGFWWVGGWVEEKAIFLPNYLPYWLILASEFQCAQSSSIDHFNVDLFWSMTANSCVLSGPTLSLLLSLMLLSTLKRTWVPIEMSGEKCLSLQLRFTYLEHLSTSFWALERSNPGQMDQQTATGKIKMFNITSPLMLRNMTRNGSCQELHSKRRQRQIVSIGLLIPISVIKTTAMEPYDMIIL